MESIKEALSEQDLRNKIKGVHAIGIRSKTKLTETVLKEANRLLCIGCFCIGTDQVNLEAAEIMGVSPVRLTRSYLLRFPCSIPHSATLAVLQSLSSQR